MCGGDDHLAWKRPVSLEACKGLRTAGGSIDTSSLGSTSWIRVGGRLIGRMRLPASRHRAYPTLEDPHARMDRLEGLRR
ncbi:hypothetical protein AAG906_016033 [Vitis piasezkii]